MFSNPVDTIMLMLLLGFFGLLVMFFFIYKALNSFFKEYNEVNRRLQATLFDIERQLMEISYLARDEQKEPLCEDDFVDNDKLQLNDVY